MNKTEERGKAESKSTKISAFLDEWFYGNSENSMLTYFRWVLRKVNRVLPSILAASAACLLCGFFFWLPDDYENMAQTVIASQFFSQNILSAITTGNYWDSINDLKPLMHMWYVGVLMEFYIIFPLLVIIIKKIGFYIHKDTMVIGGGY